MRQINLGLDLVGLAARRPRRLDRRLRRSSGVKVSSHLFRFVLFQRARMRLLLGDPDQRQSVKNGLALDFQLPGQVIDSNLAHPPRFLRTVSPKSSSQPHVVSVVPGAVLFRAFGRRRSFIRGNFRLRQSIRRRWPGLGLAGLHRGVLCIFGCRLQFGLRGRFRSDLCRSRIQA